jgi:TonB family protein
MMKTKKMMVLAAAFVPCFSLWAQNKSSISKPDEAANAIHDIGIHHGLDTTAYQVVSKARANDLRAYPDRVLAAIRKKWYPLIPQAAPGSDPGPGITMVEFSIQKDGPIDKVKVVRSSGNDARDAAARNAISAAAPFPPLPAAYSGKVLNLRYHFGYDQKPSEGGELCGPVRSDLYRPGKGITPPHAVYSPDPDYSELARHGKFQGVVLVGGTVEPDGGFSDLCLEQGAGYGLDEKALDAVKTWKFNPATKDGQPVPVHISVEVSFHLY